MCVCGNNADFILICFIGIKIIPVRKKIKTSKQAEENSNLAIITKQMGRDL